MKRKNNQISNSLYAIKNPQSCTNEGFFLERIYHISNSTTFCLEVCHAMIVICDKRQWKYSASNAFNSLFAWLSWGGLVSSAL